MRTTTGDALATLLVTAVIVLFFVLLAWRRLDRVWGSVANSLHRAADTIEAVQAVILYPFAILGRILIAAAVVVGLIACLVWLIKFLWVNAPV